MALNFREQLQKDEVLFLIVMNLLRKYLLENKVYLLSNVKMS